jgi:uncharacterized membrane protein
MALALGSPQDQVRVASGLDMIAGIWLFVSSFVFRHSGVMAMDLAVIGVIVAILAAARAFGGYRPSWPSWVNAMLGLWVLVSPWLMTRAVEPQTMWNAVITGFVIIVLAIWSALATEANEAAGQH